MMPREYTWQRRRPVTWRCLTRRSPRMGGEGDPGLAPAGTDLRDACRRKPPATDSAKLLPGMLLPVQKVENGSLSWGLGPGLATPSTYSSMPGYRRRWPPASN